MWNRLVPYLLLAALGLAFFAPLVLHPTDTLYSDHSDLLALHVPLKCFLVRSWRATGEVPLWNPYSFAGMPFVHDVQVAAFYPLHLPLYLLPEEHLGAALSWLVVLHVIVAGWCMYAYARWQGLETSGALVAGIGYMFAGKWLLHLLAAGHYIMVPLAWLPLVLLWLEQALRHGSLVRATWAGTAFALMVLGTHPQVTFYAGLFVAFWSLGPAFERGGTGSKRPSKPTPVPEVRRTVPNPWPVLIALGRWLGYGTWLLLTAVALSAVQLLPALEAAPLSTRGVVGVSNNPLGDTISTLCGFSGPALTGPAWEYRSGLGVLWLASAALAPVLSGGRVRFQAGVCLVLLCLALGGASLFQGLPGFRLFRVPSRMFLVLALPVALLAGVATQALFEGANQAPGMSRRCRWIVLMVWAVALLAVAGDVVLSQQRGLNLERHIYWMVLPLTLGFALWLVGQPMTGVHLSRMGGTGSARPSKPTPFAKVRRGVPNPWHPRRITWVALLVADLWLLAWPSLDVRPLEQVYLPSACINDLEKCDQSQGRVLDRDLPDQPGDTPLGPALPVLHSIEPVRGYNSFDIHRYKEYLQFISNQDDPVPPREGISNFPFKNLALLDLLGTRYLVQPSSKPLRAKRWRRVSTDTDPEAYCFIAGGRRRLPPYSVYCNLKAMPRAFVVPHAAALPDRPLVLEALKATDFRHTVLLEGFAPQPESEVASVQTYRPATIMEYSPNRVVIGADGDLPGWLVLTDIWYPGWSCTVDGQAETLYRANFLFRAVYVPGGAHEVVFTFAPRSYQLGKLVSGAALLVVAVLSLLAGLDRWRHRRGETTVPSPAFC
jgi:hypothetical protein